MCGRYVDPDMRSAGLDSSWLKINQFPRRYNIAPTQPVYVWTDGKAALARWGLIPSWHKGDIKDWKAATFNARIEDTKNKPSFRGPWQHGRILIPAGGYFEWTGDKSPKQPHFFSAAGNEETLWFAGLASMWQDMLTWTIMTRAANDDVEPVHDRMPVILNADERDAWLGGSQNLGLVSGARVKHRPVKRFGVGDDGPELIEPV